jgi:hypothetical protein
MIRFTHAYRWQNLTVRQRAMSIIASVFCIHFAMGTFLWLTFIWIQSSVVIRVSTPAQLFVSLMGWVPFFSRIWKSTTPLVFSALAIYFIPIRPNLSFKLLYGVAIFTVICGTYDIAVQDFDMRTFDPRSGEGKLHYFTWWWWSTTFR